MKKYKYFALDIDGTIFSSEEIIYPVYKEAIEIYCKKQNLSLIVPGRERIMLEIGKPVKTIFENLFPDLAEAHRDAISDSILGFLCERIAKGEGHYYAKVRETIDALVARGGTILVASNGRRPYVESILQYVRVLHHVRNPTYIDGEKIFTKGDILNAYSVPAQEMLMVGDRLSDLEAAEAKGCDFAWCAYGHAPAGEINRFAVRLDQFTDLIQYV